MLTTKTIRSRRGDATQLSYDGDAVWVCNSAGYTIGRFGKRGIDVHQPATAANCGECLHCTHAPTDLGDWMKFIELMDTHYGVVIPMYATPTRFT